MIAATLHFYGELFQAELNSLLARFGWSITEEQVDFLALLAMPKATSASVTFLFFYIGNPDWTDDPAGRWLGVLLTVLLYVEHIYEPFWDLTAVNCGMILAAYALTYLPRIW